jgi:hypothetical protein
MEGVRSRVPRQNENPERSRESQDVDMRRRGPSGNERNDPERRRNVQRDADNAEEVIGRMVRHPFEGPMPQGHLAERPEMNGQEDPRPPRYEDLRHEQPPRYQEQDPNPYGLGRPAATSSRNSTMDESIERNGQRIPQGPRRPLREEGLRYEGPRRRIMEDVSELPRVRDQHESEDRSDQSGNSVRRRRRRNPNHAEDRTPRRGRRVRRERTASDTEDSDTSVSRRNRRRRAQAPATQAAVGKMAEQLKPTKFRGDEKDANDWRQFTRLFEKFMGLHGFTILEHEQDYVTYLESFLEGNAHRLYECVTESMYPPNYAWLKDELGRMLGYRQSENSAVQQLEMATKGPRETWMNFGLRLFHLVRAAHPQWAPDTVALSAGEALQRHLPREWQLKIWDAGLHPDVWKCITEAQKFQE